jgi:predicted DNA-binding protein (MmcQ/YjbR family)
MTWKQLRRLCLSMPGAVETFPFEPGVSVFRTVNAKVFAIAAPEHARVRELVLDSYELVAPRERSRPRRS